MLGNTGRSAHGFTRRNHSGPNNKSKKPSRGVCSRICCLISPMQVFQRVLVAVGLLTLALSAWHMATFRSDKEHIYAHARGAPPTNLRELDAAGASDVNSSRGMARARSKNGDSGAVGGAGRAAAVLAGDGAEFQAYEAEAQLRTHLVNVARGRQSSAQNLQHWQNKAGSHRRPAAAAVDSEIAKLALEKLIAEKGSLVSPTPTPPPPPWTPPLRRTIAKMKFAPMPKPDPITKCNDDAGMDAVGQQHVASLKRAWQEHVKQGCNGEAGQTYCIARCPAAGFNFARNFQANQMMKQLVPSPRTWLPAEGLVCCEGATRRLSDITILNEGLNVSDDGVSDVTLVTQGSTNRIAALNSQLEVWPGPVVAVFAIYNNSAETRASAPGELKSLKDAANTWKSRTNVRIMVMFLERAVGDDFISAQMKTMGQLGLYPVNAMRNLALDEARTNWVFPLDMDFIPSARLYEMLRSTHLPRLSQVSRPQDTPPTPSLSLSQHRHQPFSLRCFCWHSSIPSSFTSRTLPPSRSGQPQGHHCVPLFAPTNACLRVHTFLQVNRAAVVIPHFELPRCREGELNAAGTSQIRELPLPRNFEELRGMLISGTAYPFHVRADRVIGRLRTNNYPHQQHLFYTNGGDQRMLRMSECYRPSSVRGVRSSESHVPQINGGHALLAFHAQYSRS